jgi:copper chaperone
MDNRTYDLEVKTMSCGHCVKAITEAVRELDPASDVNADLATKHVRVQTTQSRDALIAALGAAGYDASVSQAAS